MRRGRFKHTEMAKSSAVPVCAAPCAACEGLEALGGQYTATILEEIRSLPRDTPVKLRLRFLKLYVRLAKRVVGGLERAHRAAARERQRAANHVRLRLGADMRVAQPSRAAGETWSVSQRPMPLPNARRRHNEELEWRLTRACGARTKQTGLPCRKRPYRDRRTGRVRNGRCHLHGGKSTGPRTAEGRSRIREAVRARWADWRRRRALGQLRETEKAHGPRTQDGRERCREAALTQQAAIRKNATGNRRATPQ